MAKRATESWNNLTANHLDSGFRSWVFISAKRTHGNRMAVNWTPYLPSTFTSMLKYVVELNLFLFSWKQLIHISL